MPSAEIRAALACLHGARALIADQKHWIKSCSAQRADGAVVPPDHPAAVRFCTVGACAHAAPNPNPAVSALRQTLGGSIAAWNDDEERTHADVLRLFDETISRLERELAANTLIPATPNEEETPT